MGSLRSVRQAVVALAAAATVALCFGGAAGSRATTAFAGARLSIDSLSFGGHSLLAINVQVQNGLSSDEALGLAGRVDVTLPAGYQLNVSGASGSTVGDLHGGVVASADASGFTFADGPITIVDPAAWAADPLAQACAPGPHAALWRGAPTVLGRGVGVPIAVDTVASPTGESTYVLRICPTQPTSTEYPLGATLVTMSLTLANLITPPSAPGVYRWSAVITPTAQGAFALQPSSAFELRAVERRPAVLTMHARYEPKTNTIAVSGKLVAAGAPWAGATVSLSTESETGKLPDTLGDVPTGADGTFSLRIPALEPVSIYASVSSDDHACSGQASTAPAGCVNETDSTPPSVETTVIVPSATDPHLVIRGADQKLAAASVLRTSDLPGGTDEGSGPLPCEGFGPNLHRLTATGQAYSDVFLTSNGRSAAFANASVLRTVVEAKTDLAGVTKLATLRCEVKQLITDSEGEHLIGVGPLHIPRVGDAVHAFRAQVSDPLAGRLTVDVLYVRRGRVVITLHTYTVGSTNAALDLQLAGVLAARAGR